MPTSSRYNLLEAAREAYEPRYVRKLTAALYASVAPALQAAEHGASPEVCAALVQAAPLRVALEELYVRVGVAFAKAEYRNVRRMMAEQKAAKPPVTMPQSAEQRIRNYIHTDGAKDIRNITETTRKQVQKTLSEAVASGLSRDETAAALRDKIGEFTPTRALRIARTELITASNFGSLAGAKALGVPLLKYWIATPGARTRIDHALAGGETADLDGVFEDIGGEQAEYPGDPNLSAAQRVNCRCAIGYKPKE